jgi:hypothetical protein
MEEIEMNEIGGDTEIGGGEVETDLNLPEVHVVSKTHRSS